MTDKPSSTIVNEKFDTALLFLVFNRLDTTKLVFNTIKKAKPPRIYIAADGARDNNPAEEETVKQVRDYVLGQIDWDCEVKTLFRENNLGCKYAVSSAIDWFFENEEMGIILEDDCLPVTSFFWFCQDLLNKYKDDLRIWHISGNNIKSDFVRNKEFSYFFGGINTSIWGWATWRDRWKEYDVEMSDYKTFLEKGHKDDLFDGGKAVKSRLMEFNNVLNGLDTWDFQWTYTRYKNNGLSIKPTVNLIKNIGFGNKSTNTHSKKDFRANLETADIEFPLKHPSFILRDSSYEKKIFIAVPQLTWLDHLKIKLKKMLGIKI